jgi:hypothetical protein
MAQIEQRDARRQTLAQQRRYRFRQQYLAAVGGSHYASRTIDRRTKVVVVAVLDDSPMQSTAHAERYTVGRGWILQRLLQLQCRADRVERIFESGVNAIAGHFYDDAAIVLHCATGDRVMARQRRPHPFGPLVPQPRAALDIGEQEYRDRGLIVHALSPRRQAQITSGGGRSSGAKH